jgi:hypothetical protein
MLRPDFGDKSNEKDAYYDLADDWDLIEASFAKQYGIRLRSHKDMPFAEFVSLLSGLMADTPLGQIVGIRAEKNAKVIKAFTPEQRRIHTAWRRRSAEKALDNPQKLEKQWDDLSRMLNALFGKKGGDASEQRRKS